MTINPEQLLRQVAAVLERLKVRYFVTGGFAVSVWGRPRATFDVDIVAQLAVTQVGALVQALRELSPAGYVDEQAVAAAIRRGGEFNFVDPQSGAKVDFWMSTGDPFLRAQFARRRLEDLEGQPVYFVSPEDLILSKLRWHRQSGSARQLEDVASVLKISGDKLDGAYLNDWAQRLGVKELLEQVQQEVSRPSGSANS